MSIRLTVLYISIATLLIYAWKDWFKSLCCLILMMAIMEHSDMPRTMFGIQGMNLWNMLFMGVFIAWLANRRHENLRWDMPPFMTALLILYLAVILIGVARAVFDRGSIPNYSLKDLISEELINTLKWVLPAVLLFDGCRTRQRTIWAICSLLAMYFLIAVQVIRRLPFSSVLASGDTINDTRRACEDIGYGACDMSTFLAGACWAIVATVILVNQKKYKILILGAAGAVAFAQALTGGRAGYLAWGATGLTLCLLRWRKYLLLAPVLVILLPILLPGAAGRMLQGFGATDVSGEQVLDDYSMTSGRLVIWPHVIDKIGESPIVGHGRLAMARTGLQEYLWTQLRESFPHAHNMYLETLFDNGILGSIPILLVWAIVLVYSARLFVSEHDICSAVGGIGLAMMLSQLFAGIGSQHFYPEESTLGVWASMFLAMRVHLELIRARRYEAVDAAPGGQQYYSPAPVAAIT